MEAAKKAETLEGQFFFSLSAGAYITRGVFLLVSYIARGGFQEGGDIGRVSPVFLLWSVA